MTKTRVVLASQSPRRRELLDLIGITHEVIPANVDETPFANELPVPHCERLARTKALAIAGQVPDSLVIGADTVVVIDDQLLGKPVDRSDAVRMLELLSGRSHTVHSAIAIAIGSSIYSTVEAVSVTFRELSSIDIERYIATGEPDDKAGAYGIQGFGSTLVSGIDGDFFAVMGLPLASLIKLCESAGFYYPFGPLVKRES